MTTSCTASLKEAERDPDSDMDTTALEKGGVEARERLKERRRAYGWGRAEG